MSLPNLEVMVVEDEELQRQLICDRLAAAGFRVREAADGEAAIAAFEERPPDLVLMDVRLPGIDGLEATKRIKSMPVDRYVPVIACTALDDLRNKQAAFDFGVDDYLTKPFDMAELVLRIRSATRMIATLQRWKKAEDRSTQLESLVADVSKQVKRPLGAEHIVGESESLETIFGQIAPAAASEVTVLLYGETGTGKEMFARLIHANSPRRERKFRVQDCSSLPEQLLESELFGHKKGAFTGAQSDRPGLFVEAEGGTVFLDEIGDMPMAAQARLLRLLQEMEVKPVGADVPRKVDVRIIAATHRDLEALVEQGRFRRDLYYRLGQVHISLPPLRERHGDIPRLAEHFRTQYAKRYEKTPGAWTQQALDVLAAYPFPGNVRQLKNEVERIVLYYGDAPELRTEHISEEIRATVAGHPTRTNGAPVNGHGTNGIAAPTTDTATATNGDASPLQSAVESAERRAITDALTRCNFHITKTASELGLTRQGLWKKMKRLGIRGRR